MSEVDSPLLTGEMGELTPEPAGQVFYFRHRRVRQFKVGRFHFKNHMIRVEEKDFRDFERAWQGLMGIDKNSIVRVKNVENEESMASFAQKVIHGTASTDQINAPRSVLPGTQADDAKTSLAPSGGMTGLSGLIKQNQG